METLAFKNSLVFIFHFLFFLKDGLVFIIFIIIIVIIIIIITINYKIERSEKDRLWAK